MSAQPGSLASPVKTVLDNCIALDDLLTEQGGVCVAASVSRCAWLRPPEKQKPSSRNLGNKHVGHNRCHLLSAGCLHLLSWLPRASAPAGEPSCGRRLVSCLSFCSVYCFLRSTPVACRLWPQAVSGLGTFPPTGDTPERSFPAPRDKATAFGRPFRHTI